MVPLMIHSRRGNNSSTDKRRQVACSKLERSIFMGNQDISSNDEKDRPRNSSGQDSSSSIDLVRHMNSLPSFEKGESSSPKDSGQLNRSSGELGKLDRSSEELGDKSNKNFSADYMKRLQRIKSDSKKYTEGEMLDQSQSLKIAHMVDRTISNWDNAKSDFENVSKQIKLDAKSTVDDDRLLCEKLEKLNKISDDISKLIDWGRANRSKIGDSGYITSAKYSNMKSLQQEWIDLKSTFEEMIDNCSKAIEDYKHEIQSNAGEQNTHLNQRIDSLEKLRSNLNTSMEK